MTRRGWVAAGLVAGVAVAWWLNRPRPEPPAPCFDECERCGDTGDHMVVAEAGDDDAIGIDQGGTLMAATFCAEHCPGACRRGCAVVGSTR